MEPTRKTIDLVIPCYNEEPNLLALVSEIDRIMANTHYAYNYIFVDDGSTDGTYLKLKDLSKSRKNISLIKLSRNFGKEAAMTAGLKECGSDAAIILDSDLQHPPYLIPAMISEWEKGASIVDATKVNRSKENIFKRLTSRAFNSIFRGLTDFDFAGACDYKLLDKKAIQIMNNMTENTRFFRGLTQWIGLRHAKVEFTVEHRNAGSTKWNTLSLFRLSIDAVTSFSQKPLQIITVLGLFTLLFSFLLGIQTLYNKLSGHAVSGFTTVIILILISASFIMIGIGILGIYLSKIYDEIKGRPICVVEDVVSFKETDTKEKTGMNAP